jgi:hypothetical protein
MFWPVIMTLASYDLSQLSAQAATSLHPKGPDGFDMYWKFAKFIIPNAIVKPGTVVDPFTTLKFTLLIYGTETDVYQLKSDWS